MCCVVVFSQQGRFKQYTLREQDDLFFQGGSLGIESIDFIDTIYLEHAKQIEEYLLKRKLKRVSIYLLTKGDRV